MRKKRQTAVWLLAGGLLLTQAFPVWAAEDAAAAPVKTDAQIMEELGVLQGEGGGVSAGYLAKPATRMQAALLFLRLKGLESAALSYKGAAGFTDAGQVNEANQAVLGYLQANPQWGWNGTGGGSFEPGAPVTAQQYYKVLLEALGYKQDSDFTYEDTLTFARSIGLSQAADAGALRNGQIASATVEALSAHLKGGDTSLLASLAKQNVVDATKAAAVPAKAVAIANNAALGPYLVDEKGMTLYMFMKDSPNLSACKDQCAANWPAFYADSLRIPAELNAADFGTIVREDGTQQTTYRGMPLYYFIQDTQPGDTKGQGVNGLWMVFSHAGVTVSSKEGLGSYLADTKGIALYRFTKDSMNQSVCKGSCEAAWPIFYTEHVPVTGELAAAAADFGTLTREDGTKQTTFRGMPLYYYVKDQQPGDTLGQDVLHAWYVIDPAPALAPTSTAAPVSAENTADASTPNHYTVEISHFAFSQKELTVEAGATITFTNQDQVMHNAVSDQLNADGTPVFETRLLGQGESASVTLTEPGEYTYYCRPHQSVMKGTIIVK